MGTAFGIGTTYPIQPTPWGISPFGGQGIGTYPQGFQSQNLPLQQIVQLLQTVPQQLQQLQQLEYIQQQQIQQVLQINAVQVQQLQQLQQLIQFLPQQLNPQQLNPQQWQPQQQFGAATTGFPMTPQTLGTPFQASPLFGPSYGAQAAHVM
jgi:hypothetical protein